MGIGELAARAGVSVRTLRHYDAIGLLAPAKVTQAGYRLYDDAAVAKLEQILYFRELGFALDEIRKIMVSADFDAADAMKKQRALLVMQRERIDRMIARLDEAIAGMGAPRMEVFDMSEYEKAKKQYAKEAKERWGNTDAYRESEKRTAGYGKADWQNILGGMTQIFDQFAAVRELPSDDARVLALVEAWKQYITDHMYTCTDEILAGLGQMYTCDERFKANIDRSGEGTAACMARAIKAYLAKK
ncbi:MAG: MerR family transcriptional regulator [Clostridia bacterium]|nr:MerR family transcriptional regulator [Clostridia bacterium]